MGTGTHRDSSSDAARTLLDTDVAAALRQGAGVVELNLEVGQCVGRYVVLQRVGAGAVGVVFAAYDPELDRRVAIKLLQPRRSDALESSTMRSRLLREAQALARLSHPNVVTIHDVGTFEKRVYIAMEFVEGVTLRAWLDEKTRSRGEVLWVFRQAGRGLAAAHQADLVHRDFKPENVIIASDGRVKVLDFGLARAVEAAQPRPPTAPMAPVDVVASPGLSVDLTRTGGVLGTPAYMSPEQHVGLDVTARSDQFSFCVALYEALYGERPFAGESLASLALAVTGNEIRPATRSDVPAWLRRVLLRGLASDPEHRFADMQALLAALEADPAARMRRYGIFTLLGCGLAGGFLYLRQPDTDPPCSGAQARIAEVWNEAHANRIESAFGATALPYAEHAAAQVRSALDGWTIAWANGHREACEATHVHHEQSEALFDRRMHCLDRARSEIAALVDRLQLADAAVVEHAPDAVRNLPDLRSCADATRLLAARPPLSGEAAERADAIARELDTIAAMSGVGDPKGALEQIGTLGSKVESLQDPPTTYRYHALFGLLHGAVGNHEDELRHWTDAYHAADRGGDDWNRVEAAIQLATTYGYDLSEHVRAQTWLAHAGAVVDRIGAPRLLAARLEITEGTVAIKRGEYEAAIEALRRGLDALQDGETDAEDREFALQRLATALRERGHFDEAQSLLETFHASTLARFGPDHPATAGAIASLANNAYSQGDHATAEKLFEQNLAIIARVFGKESPRYMDGLNNHAVVLLAMGRSEDAEREHREILEYGEARYGPADIRLTPSLENLGNVLIAQNRFEEARDVLRRSLAIKQDVHGPDHPSTAMSEMNLGVALYQLGEHAEAERLYRHTLEVWTDKLEANHPDLGLVYANLGDVALARGRAEEAAQHQQRALDLFEPVFGSDSPDLGYALTGLGEARLALGQIEGAREVLERAAKLREGVDLPLGERARMEFALAQAVADADRPRARELAGAALDEVRTSNQRLAARIEAWLARTPAP